MSEIDKLLEAVQAIVGEWRRTGGQGTPSANQIRQFKDLIEQLYGMGWDNALGWEHELPEENLPEHYLQRRTRILDELERELGRLAVRYRSSQEGSSEEHQIISRYREVMEELFRIGHWSGEPDLDAQLPERHMPQVYKDYWARALAEYAAAKK
jgi:hypothetical protein